MRIGEIQYDICITEIEVELTHHRIDGCKEYLSPEVIMDGILYCFSLDIDSGDFCGEEQCTEYDTDDDSKSQVACEQYDDYCQNHDERIVRGAFAAYLNEPQSNVPMDTMTMMPAKIGMGICTTQSPRTMIRNMRNAPAVNVESRVVAPAPTLITDCPIIAHPPMPPKKPVMKLAMPCPRDSLFLLLNESVALSTI